MPRRNYRAARLIQKPNSSFFGASIYQSVPMSTALTTTQQSSSTNNTQNTRIATDTYTPYEQTLLTIIQSVKDRISFDILLTQLEPLQTEIKSRAQAEKVLYSIQEIITGTIQNITDRVRLDIAMKRLLYITDIIKTATDLPVIYNNIADLLEYIIDSITNRENLETVLANLVTTQTAMTIEVNLSENIFIIQEVLIGCVQNIIDGVNPNLIINRMLYLSRRMQEALNTNTN